MNQFFFSRVACIAFLSAGLLVSCGHSETPQQESQQPSSKLSPKKNLSQADKNRIRELVKEIKKCDEDEAELAKTRPGFKAANTIKRREKLARELANILGVSVVQNKSERPAAKVAVKGATSGRSNKKSKSHQSSIATSQIKGVVYHWGERTRSYSRSLGTYLYEWEGGGVYLVMKDGTAVFNPDVSPADFDLKAFKRKNPGKIKKLADVDVKKKDIYPPRKRGYTLDIYVERPSTSVSFSSTLSSWKELRLTKAGRFETGKTSLRAMNSNPADQTYGAEGQSNYASSSGKNGRFTAGSANLMGVGGGTAMVRRGKGNAGKNSGTYLIDGNTIELRYENGQVVRSLFGTDGKENVILGDINYWTPKKK